MPRNRPFARIQRVYGCVFSAECVANLSAEPANPGIIKGSEQTLEYEDGYIDRKGYLALSHRANSTFAAKRDLIYGIFQSYVKRKRELGDFDPADRYVSMLVTIVTLSSVWHRSRMILRHIQSVGLHSQKIDFLFVLDMEKT